MAERPKVAEFASLISVLANTGSGVKSNALYQTVFILLQRLTEFRNFVTDTLVGPDGDGGLKNATYITVDDETATLQNSRQLIAGSGITLSLATDGQIIISSSGGGGSSTDHVALSDGAVGLTPPQIIHDSFGNFIYVPYTP